MRSFKYSLLTLAAGTGCAQGGWGKAHTVGLQNFSAPSSIEADKLYLAGNWEFSEEFAENKSAKAKIIFRYRARSVYLVAGSDSKTRITIIKDGAPSGQKIVDKHQLYEIIEDAQSGEHMLEIIIETPGLRAFTFTFG